MKNKVSIGWRTIAGVLIVLTGFFNAGCESANPQESHLPWARPADWEGGAPGLGGGSLDRGRTGY